MSMVGAQGMEGDIASAKEHGVSVEACSGLGTAWGVVVYIIF